MTMKIKGTPEGRPGVWLVTPETAVDLIASRRKSRSRTTERASIVASH